MKKLFPMLMLLACVVFALSFTMLEGRTYTYATLVGTDTILSTAADTLTFTVFNEFADSTGWVFGIAADQTQDSVGLKVDAYWSSDAVIWTDAQAVVADHTTPDWILETYVPEHISKFFKYGMIIITGTVNNDKTDATICKTYCVWRKPGY